MDANTIMNMVTSVAFPIVACIYLATTMNKTLADLTTAINEMKLSDQQLKAAIEKREEVDNGK